MIQDKPAAFLANTLQHRPLKRSIISFAPCLSWDPRKTEYGICVLRPHYVESLRLKFTANIPSDFITNIIEICDLKNTDIVVRKFTSEDSKYDPNLNDDLHALLEVCCEKGVPMAAIRQCKYRQFFTCNLPPTDRNFKLAMKEFGGSYGNLFIEYVLSHKNMIEAFALAKYYEYLLGLDSYASKSLGLEDLFD